MISLTKKKRCRPGLLGIEKLGIIYAAFTAVVAAVFYNYIPSIGEMAITRVGYAAGMAALILIYRNRPCHLTFFLRIALQLGMLATWYPETYLFCSIFGNLDHVFAQADQFIFGCQPALLFCQIYVIREITVSARYYTAKYGASFSIWDIFHTIP